MRLSTATFPDLFSPLDSGVCRPKLGGALRPGEAEEALETGTYTFFEDRRLEERPEEEWLDSFAAAIIAAAAAEISPFPFTAYRFAFTLTLRTGDGEAEEDEEPDEEEEEPEEEEEEPEEDEEDPDEEPDEEDDFLALAFTLTLFLGAVFTFALALFLGAALAPFAAFFSRWARFHAEPSI